MIVNLDFQDEEIQECVRNILEFADKIQQETLKLRNKIKFSATKLEKENADSGN